MEQKDFDPVRIDTLEEAVYHTSNALEALLNVMVEKGMVTEQELIDKMDVMAEHEDVEELGHDADAPREHDKDE
ncbi:hypothetical protein GF367_01725 [Candidatus Woesearchaeota archaeon]|nr:hypothetical protein [Candidatus Woesearchaeota archaeon]